MQGVFCTANGDDVTDAPTLPDHRTEAQRPVGPTLNDRLSSLGYTTAPAPGHSIGSEHILRDGKIVFTGDSFEVWTWLQAERAPAGWEWV